MTTAIPHTVLSEILASKLSAETIVSLLNEEEKKYLSTPRHANTKYGYPFWKVCQHCSKPFMTHNRYQAVRNKTCNKECAVAMTTTAVTGRRTPIATRKGKTVVCAVCGKKVWKPDAWLRRVQIPTCGYQCNGVLRGADWKEHAHKGRANWTESSKTLIKERMTGVLNPAWKGGLTYRNRKGLYAAQPIKYVRCPTPMLTMARKDGYVMEHRLLVALKINRQLMRSEVVHHINHNATDNRIENLMLFSTNARHKAFEHGADIKPLWCGLCHSTTPEKSGVCVCQPGHLSLSETV